MKKKNTLIALLALAFVSSAAIAVSGVSAKANEVTFDTVDFTSFSMEEGAYIRTEGNGLKFTAVMSQDTYDALEGLEAVSGVSVSYGMVIVPYDMVKDTVNYGELTEDNLFTAEGNYADVDLTIMEADTLVDLTINGSIVGIQNANITREFVGRAFVKYTDGTTTKYEMASYYDGDIKNNAFSMTYIAQKAEEAGQLDDVTSEALYDNYFSKIQDVEFGYTVKYHKIAADGSETVESEVKWGELGAEVTAAAKVIDGYKYQEGYAGEVNSGVIYANGKTTLDIYYAKVFTLSGSVSKIENTVGDLTATTLTFTGDKGEYTAEVAADGSYEIEVPAGEYDVKATHANYFAVEDVVDCTDGDKTVDLAFEKVAFSDCYNTGAFSYGEDGTLSNVSRAQTSTFNGLNANSWKVWTTVTKATVDWTIGGFFIEQGSGSSRVFSRIGVQKRSVAEGTYDFFVGFKDDNFFKGLDGKTGSADGVKWFAEDADGDLVANLELVYFNNTLYLFCNGSYVFHINDNTPVNHATLTTASAWYDFGSPLKVGLGCQGDGTTTWKDWGYSTVVDQATIDKIKANVAGDSTVSLTVDGVAYTDQTVYFGDIVTATSTSIYNNQTLKVNGVTKATSLGKAATASYTVEEKANVIAVTTASLRLVNEAGEGFGTYNATNDTYTLNKVAMQTLSGDYGNAWVFEAKFADWSDGTNNVQVGLVFGDWSTKALEKPDGTTQSVNRMFTLQKGSASNDIWNNGGTKGSSRALAYATLDDGDGVKYVTMKAVCYNRQIHFYYNNAYVATLSDATKGVGTWDGVSGKTIGDLGLFNLANIGVGFRVEGWKKAVTVLDWNLTTDAATIQANIPATVVAWN